MLIVSLAGGKNSRIGIFLNKNLWVTGNKQVFLGLIMLYISIAEGDTFIAHSST